MGQIRFYSIVMAVTSRLCCIICVGSFMGCYRTSNTNSIERKLPDEVVKPGGTMIEIPAGSDANAVTPEVGSVSCQVLDDLLASKLSTKPSITALFCSDCGKLTDVGVESIAALPLRILALKACDRLTDLSLRSISTIATLSELSLTHSRKASFSRDGIALLGTLGKLNELDLSGNEWLDASYMPAIQQCTPLRSLSLRQCTSLTSQSVATLQDVGWLDISENEWLSDATLKEIGRLSGISVVVIRKCHNVSDSAIADFRKANAYLEIVADR